MNLYIKIINCKATIKPNPKLLINIKKIFPEIRYLLGITTYIDIWKGTKYRTVFGLNLLLTLQNSSYEENDFKKIKKDLIQKLNIFPAAFTASKKILTRSEKKSLDSKNNKEFCWIFVQIENLEFHPKTFSELSFNNKWKFLNNECGEDQEIIDKPREGLKDLFIIQEDFWKNLK